jgi:hypothetical protein
MVDQAVRAAGLLVLQEAQQAAGRHPRELRLIAAHLSITAGAGLAFLTAFALANWAGVAALAGSLPGWAAPLVLAAAWLAVAIVCVLVIRRKHTMTAEVVAETQTPAAPQPEVRGSLERVAEGVVDEGEHILDRIDEITHDLAETIPGGTTLNWAANLALIPGRRLTTLARAALRR